MTPPSSSADQRDATPTGSEPAHRGDPPTTDAVDVRKCPACLYSLCGLPTRHTCPECGFEYDEHVRLWEAPPQSRAREILRFCSGFVVLAISCIFFAPISLAGWMLTVFCFVLVAHGWAASRHRDYTAVTSAGIFHRVQSLRTSKIPWSKVDEVWFRGKKQREMRPCSARKGGSR